MEEINNTITEEDIKKLFKEGECLGIRFDSALVFVELNGRKDFRLIDDKSLKSSLIYSILSRSKGEVISLSLCIATIKEIKKMGFLNLEREN